MSQISRCGCGTVVEHTQTIEVCENCGRRHSRYGDYEVEVEE